MVVEEESLVILFGGDVDLVRLGGVDITVIVVVRIANVALRITVVVGLVWIRDQLTVVAAISDAVAVPVREGARIHLVDDRGLPPAGVVRRFR